MGRSIIKIKDKYFEWSSIVDAPITWGMDKEELEEHIKFKYGEEGLLELPERLKRVEKFGTSLIPPTKLKELILCNRAGKKESCLSVNEIYEHYLKPSRGKK